MASHTRPLAIVTGASSGIGYELATCCADQGFDLLIAADEPAITEAAQNFRARGVAVEAIEAGKVKGRTALSATSGGRGRAAARAAVGSAAGLRSELWRTR